MPDPFNGLMDAAAPAAGSWPIQPGSNLADGDGW